MDSNVTFSVFGQCLVSENQPRDAVNICIATMSILFGIVYTLFGYRCFKACMFLTGFIFASVIVYLICIREKLLPPYANVGIALVAGILFGLITMLVQYVGLFMTGFHTGLLLGVASLALIDYLYMQQAVLTMVADLLASGLLFAVLNLLWKRSLTILGTVVYGGALIAAGVDFLLDGSNSARWLWRPRDTVPCYAVLALWPTAAFVGLITQACSTAPRNHHGPAPYGGKHYHHHSAARGVVAKGQGGRRVATEGSRAEARQNKYRYLYQVRTQHGDVISQSYVQALQQGKVMANDSSTLDSDATHLTMLPSDR